MVKLSDIAVDPDASPEFQEAFDALKRIQQFDIDTLERAADLGKDYKFTEVLEPARQIVELFKLIPLSALRIFPPKQLNAIKDQANTSYNRFSEILSFSAKSENAAQQHQQLVNGVTDAPQAIFDGLSNLISHAMARTVDYTSLAEQGRAAVQQVKDQAATLTKELQEHNGQATEILKGIREAAAETGVTQQAKYFEGQATHHETQAGNWRWATIVTAVAVFAFGVGSLFFHKWDWIAPTNVAESIQFIASKILIFSVLAYMLFLCSRNFLSHRHNQIINKHRQMHS